MDYWKKQKIKHNFLSKIYNLLKTPFFMQNNRFYSGFVNKLRTRVGRLLGERVIWWNRDLNRSGWFYLYDKCPELVEKGCSFPNSIHTEDEETCIRTLRGMREVATMFKVGDIVLPRTQADLELMQEYCNRHSLPRTSALSGMRVTRISRDADDADYNYVYFFGRTEGWFSQRFKLAPNTKNVKTKRIKRL